MLPRSFDWYHMMGDDSKILYAVADSMVRIGKSRNTYRQVCRAVHNNAHTKNVESVSECGI